MGPTLTILISIILFINIISFLLVFADKRKAQKGHWRIPEKAFLLLALFGGGIGVLAGFFLFRHKIRHVGLITGLFLLTVLFYVVAAVVATK
jgi:uncharacterized membrane protein YsdA (DUF1294 family)